MNQYQGPGYGWAQPQQGYGQPQPQPQQQFQQQPPQQFGQFQQPYPMQQPPQFAPQQGQQFQYPPQQQMQMPPQQFQGPPGFQQTQAPGPTQLQPAAPTSPNGFFIPNEQLIQQSWQAAQETKKKMMQARTGQFSKLRFLQILGPNGSPWKTAPVAFVGGKAIYLMPAWKEGVLNYIERYSRFWKSKQFPQGSSINDSGGNDTLVAKAYQLALDAGQKSPWLRLQKKFVYQGFPYEWDPFTTQLTHLDPSQCVHDDGTLRPILLEAGSDLHTMIQEIAHQRGFVKTFHPDMGRPIAIKKTKTGPEQLNVEYSAIDLDPQPLADIFRPGLHYLYALDELFKPATVEEQINAIQDAGLPMPMEAGGFQGQAQTGWTPPQQQFQQQGYGQLPPNTNPYAGGVQSWQQAPNPPQPNPYQQAPQQNWPPQQGQLPQQSFPQPQFMPQQMQPKPLPPPPAGAGTAANTPMLPPQQYGQQQQFQQMPPQQQPPPQGAPQQPQQQVPLTPEQMQQQLMGGGDIPF